MGDPHLATSRIALEDFLAFLIDDFGIPATMGSYQAVLSNNRRKFFEHCERVWDWAKQTCQLIGFLGWPPWSFFRVRAIFRT
jgi:hypothetical protein